MADTMCPIECVRVGCPEPDFLERNGAWLLTVIGGLGTGVGMLLTYFLKSRCKHIECCGVVCDREVLDLNDKQISSKTVGALNKA